MNCMQCGGKLQTHREDRQEAILGLPHVILHQVAVRRCTQCDEEEVVLPKIESLHRELVGLVLRKKGHLIGDEVRFLRKFLGWSGEDFARRMGVRPESVSRWENDRAPMGGTAERLLRMYVAQATPVQDYPLERLDSIDDGEDGPLHVSGRLQKTGWKLVPA